MQSRRSERVKPSRSYAWPWRIYASTTCLCRSVGKAARWRSLSLNWAPSIQTNQPKKPSATGILFYPGLFPVIYARPPKAHEVGFKALGPIPGNPGAVAQYSHHGDRCLVIFFLARFRRSGGGVHVAAQIAAQLFQLVD